MARGRRAVEPRQRFNFPRAYFFYLFCARDDGTAVLVGTFSFPGKFSCERLAGMVFFCVLDGPAFLSMVCLSAGALAWQEDGNNRAYLVYNHLGIIVSSLRHLRTLANGHTPLIVHFRSLR